MSIVISIIVPVYNAEKYLSQCINSILAQEFSNFELLLINDGSHDNSGKICDEYAQKDERIRVFHKKNGGVSSARNLGLDNAKGEWVSFIDADDIVSPDFLSIHTSGEKGIDVIQKSFVLQYEDGVQRFYNVKYGILKNRDDLFRFYIQKRSNVLWNKIISMRLINGKRFDESVTIGEDFLFFLSLIGDIQFYAFDPIGCYIYQVHSNSAMAKINRDRLKRIQILFSNIKNVKKITLQQDLYSLGNCIIGVSYINELWKCRKFLDDLQKRYFEHYLLKIKLKDLKYASCKQKVSLYIKLILFKIIKNIYN